jgi:hypothetical protein
VIQRRPRSPLVASLLAALLVAGGLPGVALAATPTLALSPAGPDSVTYGAAGSYSATLLDPADSTPVKGVSVSFDAVPSGGGTIVPLGSDITDATGVATLGPNPVEVLGAGHWLISAHSASHGTWDPSDSLATDLTVGKATLTVTANAQTVAFGSPPPVLTTTVTDFAYGQSASTADGYVAPTCSSSYTNTSPAGVPLTISCSGGSATNYDVPTDTATLTVTKAAQTITFTSAAPTNARVGGSPYTPTASATSGLDVAISRASGSSGVCSMSGGDVSFIGAGTCTLHGDQAGDGNHEPAPQVSQSFTVSSTTTTTTTVDTSNSPSAYGEDVTFVANVNPSAATGSVQFAIDGAPFGGPVPLVNGSATSGSISSLTVGTHPVTATFTSDDLVNFTSSSGTLPGGQIVGKAAQTISFAALPGKTFGDVPFTVSATASSGLTVTFSSTTTSVCTVSGTTVTIVAVGSCTVRASQTGNANYSAATPVDQTFAVGKAAQTISFAALADKTFDQSPITVSATATSGLPVTFSSLTTPICTVSGTTVTFVTIGSCTIRASQAGNANFAAAPDVEHTFAVGKDDQTISFAALPGKTYGDVPFTVSATATSGLPVTFSSLTTPVCTVSGTTVTIVAAGSCTIRASQPGNATWNAAPGVDRTFAVAKAAQTIAFGAPADRTYGDVPFTVSATATSGLPVTFSSLTTPVCTASGTTVTIVAAGNCTIRASQPGNANYSAAPDVEHTFAVGKKAAVVTANNKSRPYGAADPAFDATITGLVPGDSVGSPACSTSPEPSKIVGGSGYPITCTLGGLSTANYTYAFVGGTLTITPAPLTLTAQNASRQYGLDNPSLSAVATGFVNGEDATSAGLTGTAVCTTTAQVADGVGTRPITCGTGSLAAPNYAFTTFVPGVLTIAPAVATPVVTSSVNPAAGSAPVTFTASVTWPTGTPTGTVTFYEGATPLAGPIGIIGGIAQLSTSTLTIGNHEITAAYSSTNANFASVTSPAFTQSVGTSAVAATLDSNRATWETSVPITFTATLVPAASGVTVPVTGTVQFRVDTVLRATIPVASGKASYASPALKAGTHTVVATYIPDAAAATYFTAGAPGTLTKRVVANTVSASGVGVSRSTIYPVRDDWKDTVSVRGTRLERLAVSIAIYSSSGRRVKAVSIARSTGAYAYTWTGRTSSGKVLPAGRYKVVQTLADAYGAKRKYTSYVTLSKKRMYWYSRTLTVSKGPRNYQMRSTANTAILSGPSSTSTGALGMVNAASAPTWLAVGYQFTLPSASTYRSLSFQVKGSWTGATAPKIGLIPWNGGNWGSIYSLTRARAAMGTNTATYYSQTLSGLGGINSGRSVRASIDSFAAPSGYGPGPFSYSITAVRLVARYGILK